MNDNDTHPLLLLTRDDALWQHWRQLGAAGWAPHRAARLADARAWREQGREWLIADAALVEPSPPVAGAAVFDGLKALVLSTQPGDAQGRAAFAQGASGYAHAWSAPEQLATILQTIASGSIWTGRGLLQQLLADVGARLPRPAAATAGQPPAWAATLTPREQAVAQLAALGHSNQDIAQALDITERTVRAHLSASFEKLQVGDRLMLALKVHGISG